MATARKKAANKDLSDPKQYAQVVRFLTYRGYAWDYVKECLDKIKKEQEEK
jgi:SOS response regulatory protein OraA/RecX